MEGRTGMKPSLLIVTLLVAASLAGCGGGGGSGDAANPNTEAFTSALMNTGVFYLRGSDNSYSAGKVTSSGMPTVIGAEYTYTDPAWAVTGSAGYFLDNAGGWQAFSAPSSFVDNGDGSYTVSEIYIISIDSVTDLAGQSPACINSSGATVVCPSAQTYATGAKRYSSSATMLVDYYSLYYQISEYTDLNGAPMAALPTSGSTGYCVRVIAGSSADLYSLAAGGSTYELRHATDCTLPEITIGLSSAELRSGITITSSGRNGVTVALINYPAGVFEPANSFVIGEHGGNYWFGSYLPAAGGTPSSNTYYNRTASDTLTAAHGLPVLP